MAVYRRFLYTVVSCRTRQVSWRAWLGQKAPEVKKFLHDDVQGHRRAGSWNGELILVDPGPGEPEPSSICGRDLLRMP